MRVSIGSFEEDWLKSGLMVGVGREEEGGRERETGRRRMGHEEG